eukprot:1491180-Rhodomonas_salina.1
MPLRASSLCLYALLPYDPTRFLPMPRYAMSGSETAYGTTRRRCTSNGLRYCSKVPAPCGATDLLWDVLYCKRPCCYDAMGPISAMSGTELRSAATALRVCYAMSGTELGYATTRYIEDELVRQYMVLCYVFVPLRACYAVSSTDVPDGIYAPTRFIRVVRYQLCRMVPVCLPACYAMPVSYYECGVPLAKWYQDLQVVEKFVLKIIQVTTTPLSDVLYCPTHLLCYLQLISCTMPGTVLRIPYAASGIALCVGICDAMCGTELAYAATRVLRNVRY